MGAMAAHTPGRAAGVVHIVVRYVEGERREQPGGRGPTR